MDLISTKVLNDCKFACWELTNAEENNNLHAIKLRWFTCLALLRSVGHVLDKVDKKNNSKYAQIFKDHFKNKKEDNIFVNFIDRERNLILKEYEDRISEKVEEVSECNVLVDEAGNRIVTEDYDSILLSPSLVTKYFNKGDGFGKNRLLHEVVEMGIEWWETYINELIDLCRNQ